MAEPDYQAMWEDACRHRDQAERRARRLMEQLAQIQAIICPDEEANG